ncbi:MAG: hypothetical protein FWH17_09350 [Oscillospiraceae bacterium]|nr:hypothetical protein [Oscillospiraceae bacterium]
MNTNLFRITAGLIILVMFTAGCGSSGANTNTPAPTDNSRYDWLDNGTETPTTPQIPAWWYAGWGGVVFIPLVNGEYNSEATYHYSKPEIDMTLQYKFDTELPTATCRLMLLIDGYIQPFFFEDETEEIIVKEMELEPNTIESYISTVRLTPLIATPDEPSFITVLFLPGFTNKLSAPSMIPADIHTAMAFSVQVIPQSGVPARNDLPKTEESVLTRIGEAEEGTTHLEIYSRANNNANLYQEFPAGSSLDVGLTQRRGDYRMILMVDGRPSPAFDGSIYLDYTVEDSESIYGFTLAPNVFSDFGEETHNIWLLNYPQKVEFGETWHLEVDSTPPTTVRVLP